VHCTKISSKFKFEGHSHLGAHLQKYGTGLRRWKNQRRLSSLEETIKNSLLLKRHSFVRTYMMSKKWRMSAMLC